MTVLFLAVIVPALAAQAPDSGSTSDPDRIVIDAAAIVREGGVHSLADLLNSRVPGLLVIQGSGLNGGGSRIRFPGPRRLLSDGSPLILVDGIRVDAAADAALLNLGGPGPLRLEDFNIEDIESIEIERSPAGGMLYGPGAAEGLILIRTKRGRSGPLQADGFAQGVLESVPARWPTNYGGVDADNPDLRMRSGGCTLAHQAAGYCVQDFVQSFNPLVQRSPFATSMRHHAGFHATGGPSWGAFRLAGGIDGDGGVYDIPVAPNPDSYNRWNVTSSGTIRPDPRVDLGFTLTHLSSNLALPAYGPIQSALLGPSDSAGFAWAPMFGYSAREKVGRFTGVVEANVRLLPWLSAHGLLGLDKVEQGDTAVVPGSIRFYGRRNIRQTTSALTVSGDARPGASFRFLTTVGVDLSERRRRVDQRVGPDTVPFCATLCGSQWLSMRHRTNGIYLSERMSVRERLVVSAALRRDHFFEYRQHQTNPSLAISWLARRDRPGRLSGLRLHAAYGSASETGSVDGLDVVLVPIGTTLPAVRPDRVKSVEAGVEARLFDGRWRAHVTAYDLRSDVMRLVAVPSTSGCCVYTYASGTTIGNRGVVAMLAGPVLERASVRWDMQLSVWGNRNRLLSLFGPEAILNDQGLLEGYPTAGYWGERITGYADANQDGIIDVSEVAVDQRLTWAGTPYPTQGAGLQSSLRLGHHLRISTTLDYRAGHVLYNQSAWYRCQLSTVCHDRNDPQTPLQRQAVAVAPYHAVPLQYFEDADYLKLRELQISFAMPPNFAGVMGAHDATVSLAARNLFTWTRYSGGDPEAGSYGSMTPGPLLTVADFGTVPVPRSWSLRVRVSY
jgi:hypothetical protein